MSERSPTLEWLDRFDARLAGTPAPLTRLESSLLAGAIRAERLPPEPWELEAAERWEREHRDEWKRAQAEQVSQPARLAEPLQLDQVAQVAHTHEHARMRHRGLAS